MRFSPRNRSGFGPLAHCGGLLTIERVYTPSAASSRALLGFREAFLPPRNRMRTVTASAVLLILLVAISQPAGHADDVEIQTSKATALENQGKDQLRRLLRDFPLEPYLFTKVILIQSGVIPHSHPVLTLNTRYLDDDIAQLGTFLHEQFHWFLDDHVPDDLVEAAIAELKALFPNAPDAPPEGARGSRSTYLHLIVCALELEALASLVGRSRAREQLSEWEHYTWVYRTVLNHTQGILDVMTKAGIPLLTSPQAGFNTR